MDFLVNILAFFSYINIKYIFQQLFVNTYPPFDHYNFLRMVDGTRKIVFFFHLSEHSRNFRATIKLQSVKRCTYLTRFRVGPHAPTAFFFFHFYWKWCLPTNIPRISLTVRKVLLKYVIDISDNFFPLNSWNVCVTTLDK